jgi:prepilin signal peptidase PulO-like enzyme (type II secretory pathway)
MQQPPLHPDPLPIAGFLLFGLLANVAVWRTVAEVNARLPNDQKFSWLWWTIGKYARLWAEHKRFCPGSHWRLYSVVSFLTAILFMILAVWSVRVPST